MKPLLGAVADDFTGATDLANMLARAGMRTVLALGRPAPDDPMPEAEAVVVALKSRTAPVPEAVEDSLASWRWLAAAGAEQCYFKYCSTFDSTQQGNIGPVSAALMAETEADFTVYCPAFPEAGRTIYQGNLFVFQQPLNESPLKDHPLTPMTDANLARWLSPQLGGAQVGLIAFQDVEAGAVAIRARMDALRADGVRHAIVDALTDDHLAALGEACAGMALVTAGSGLGLGLPGNFARAGRLAGGRADALPAIGGLPVLLSGSCSAATNAQVARWEADGGPTLRLDPLALADGSFDAQAAWDWARAQPGAALIAATQPPDKVRETQAKLGTEKAAELVEATLSSVAIMARDAGVRRFVVAGGETSGAVVSALGAARLAVGPQIAPGVPWCATLADTASDTPAALALKSGNFGGETFFADALESAP
ncbi:MAG: 3-oxo-tetronate kinase [Pseudomonadota bacterium]